MWPKVLLIYQSPRKPKLFANTLPPLGILGIASYLEKNHIPVDVIDYQIKNKAKVNPKNYDIVGLSVNMANIANSLELIKDIKIQNSKIKVIVGGPSCISEPQYFTQNENIDAVCTGEGEHTLLDYITQESFIDGKEIPGLYTKAEKGYFIYGGDRKYIDNLDELPFPALNKINLAKYNVLISKEYPVSNIMTSRGCPFRCIFCFHSMGYNWRARSPLNVIDEIEWQVKELGVKEICIQDDNLSLDIDRAKLIFDLIIRRNIKVKLQLWSGLRADFVDFELLNKMHKAGVWLIAVAPETGSLRVMNEIKKNIDLEKVKQVVQWCRKIGINTSAYFMIGFQFETIQDIRQTASFMKELNPDFMQLGQIIPIPTTPLYKLIGGENLKNLFCQEQGYFFGHLKINPSKISNKEVRGMIKRMHRNFYLNPSKMMRLMKILSLPRLIVLFAYAIRTKNI